MSLKKCFKTNLRQQFTVAIEGNIGSGKTVFLNHFKPNPNYYIINEPLEKWRNCQGHNLFSHVYENPKKWAFSFQSYVQLTMLENHLRTNDTNRIKLMERSIYSARYCFCEKLLKDDVFSEAEVAVLDQWFQWICGNTNMGLDLIVYLRTTPEIVFERIKKRKRNEESGMTLKFLQDLHQLHENWLVYRTGFKVAAPVLILNGDLDLSEINVEYSKCELEIRQAIQHMRICL